MEFEGRARISRNLDLAPLIDVVFLLLVFFMLTSAFIVQESIDLSLPEARSAQSVEEAPIIISVQADGTVTVGSTEVELVDLSEKLKQKAKGLKEPRVTLRTDAKVEVQQMVSVMDEIREAGILNISLATRP